MRNLLLLIIVLFFFSCDNSGSYTFKVKNMTSKPILIIFNDSTYGSPYRDTANHINVKISIGEEKTIRIISSPLNNTAHNCLQMHGMYYFHDLIFDTYLENKKIKKQLWQPDNWTYKKDSKWMAEYHMNITDELCK